MDFLPNPPEEIKKERIGPILYGIIAYSGGLASLSMVALTNYLITDPLAFLVTLLLAGLSSTVTYLGIDSIRNNKRWAFIQKASHILQLHASRLRDYWFEVDSLEISEELEVVTLNIKHNKQTHIIICPMSRIQFQYDEAQKVRFPNAGCWLDEHDLLPRFDIGDSIIVTTSNLVLGRYDQRNTVACN